MTGKPAYQPADLFAAVVDDTIPHDASLRPTKALALSKRELATVRAMRRLCGDLERMGYPGANVVAIWLEALPTDKAHP